MAELVRIRPRLRDTLIRRRTITLDLPEFAIQPLWHRAEIANEGATNDEDRVSFNDVAEWYLLSPLSVKDMPELEQAVPGFTAALTAWLFQATYSPSE